MSIVDFKDIPAGNTGGDGQDKFELFCREYLHGLGFEIIEQPSRGADGKKDMVVKAKFEGQRKAITWLVSCKHNAHSNKSVSDKDEINITERLAQHNCEGFLGMYSTIPAQSLTNLLSGQQFPSKTIDHEEMERNILNKRGLKDLFWRFFTPSYDKHKQYLSSNNKSTASHSNQATPNLTKQEKMTEEDFLRISKSALIIIELEKIKEKFYATNDWQVRGEIIGELYKYSDHTNIVVAENIYTFLNDVAHLTRSGLTEGVAISTMSLIINFFPYSEDRKDDPKIQALAEYCASTGFSMAYDASIYTKNYDVLMYALTILKYIYKKGKENNWPSVVDKVYEEYSHLEDTLKRPERFDLGDAQEFVKFFKADLNEHSLSFPPLNDRLYSLIYPDR